MNFLSSHTRLRILPASALFLIAPVVALAGTISGHIADYNAAAVVNASGVLTVPASLVVYQATASLSVGTSIVVTLPSGFSFGTTPTLTSSGSSTFTVASGGMGANSVTYTLATAAAASGDSFTLGTFGVTGATALGTRTAPANALPVTMQAMGSDASPLSFPAFASAPGLQVISVGAIQYTDPAVLGTKFVEEPDSFTAVYAAVAVTAQVTDGSTAVLKASGVANTISNADTYNLTLTSDFRGYGQAFGSTRSDCTNSSFTGSVTPTSITIQGFPIGVEEFICVVGSGQPLASQPNGHTNVVVTPGTSTDFQTASIANGAVNDEFPGEVCYGMGGTCALNPNVITAVPLQLSVFGPLSLTVVPNESLQATGIAPVFANQSASWTATTATPWLSLFQTTGSFPAMPEVTANAAGLAAGTYSGSISVTGSAGGTTQSVTVPVTLTVTPPAALTVSPSAVLQFTPYPAVSTTSYTLQTGSAGVAFTASTSASSAGWLTVSPKSGVAPTPVTVTIDPTKATAGTYSDLIVFTSPGLPPVNVPAQMTLSYALLPQQVNSATGTGPDHTVAPNEIVSLYLSDFACATAPSVSINGTPVSYSAWVPGQINYAVPANLTSPAFLTATCGTSNSWTSYSMTMASAMPGIFTFTGTASGQAAVVNSDGSLNGATNPAARGGVLSVYGTGFGAYNAPGANGQKTLAGTVTATIGGMPATMVYAGSVPGSTDGLQRFDLQIPSGIAAGSAVPVVLMVNGASTQTTATVALK